MGKSRMMGAGNASATLYKCDPNIPTGGGNKKQGITSRVGLNNWENREVQTSSNGVGRFKLFFMNQLGGVEPGHSMFGGYWNKGDGLSMSLYEPQVIEKIKQDENNGIIVNPSRYYSGKPRATPSLSCKLYHINDSGTNVRFKTNPNACYINPSFTLTGQEIKIDGIVFEGTMQRATDNYGDTYYLIFTIVGVNFNDITSVIIKGYYNDTAVTLEY